MPDYVYSNRSQRWRNQENGQFVSETVVFTEMQRVRDATVPELQDLTRRLYAGQISLPQWQTATAQVLADAHIAQSMFAVGGRANMTQANWGRVGGVLQGQYRFLAEFAQAIANGEKSEAQALDQIAQYGRNTQQAFYREYAYATPDNQVIDWVLGVADHCRPSAGKYGCVELAAGSPYTADTLPTVPGAAATTCHGKCNCTIHRRAA